MSSRVKVPDTARQRIKEKASYYIHRFSSVPMSFEKAKGAAVVLVEELKANFELNFRSDYTSDAELEYEYKLAVFDEVLSAIRAF